MDKQRFIISYVIQFRFRNRLLVILISYFRLGLCKYTNIYLIRREQISETREEWARFPLQEQLFAMICKYLLKGSGIGCHDTYESWHPRTAQVIQAWGHDDVSVWLLFTLLGQVHYKSCRNSVDGEGSRSFVDVLYGQLMSSNGLLQTDDDEYNGL